MTTTTITCVYQEKIIRRDKGESNVITIVLWLIMINLRAFVNLLESFVKQDQHLKIMNLFRELEEMMPIYEKSDNDSQPFVSGIHVI